MSIVGAVEIENEDSPLRVLFSPRVHDGAAYGASAPSDEDGYCHS